MAWMEQRARLDICRFQPIPKRIANMPEPYGLIQEVSEKEETSLCSQPSRDPEKANKVVLQ
jgi:hypothetical protein